MPRTLRLACCVFLFAISPSFAAPGKEKRALLDFDDQADVKKVILDESGAVAAERSDQGATSGQHSLKLTFKAGHDYSGFELEPSLLTGWTEFDFLAIDFTSDDKALMVFTPELWDANTTGYPTRCTWEDHTAPPPVHKGKNTILLDLRLARLNGHEAVALSQLTATDRIDLTKVTKFKAWFHTNNRKTDFVVYMDNVRLLQEGALESNMKIDLPMVSLAFDFGKDSPVVEGFTAVSPDDVFGNDKLYGFVDPKGLAALGKDYPDPLTGDCIGPVFVNDEPQEATWEFRAKVPPGQYLIWVNAETFPWPNRDAQLTVQGADVFKLSAAGDEFYSETNFFRFLGWQYSGKPNATWRSAVAKSYPSSTTVADVAHGVITITGRNVWIGALVVVPADQQAAFTKLAEQVESERIRYFYKDIYPIRPENEPMNVTDPQLVLFAPADGTNVMPWSGMGKADAQEILRVAAPGEMLYMQVALRPFQDLPGVKLTLTDFKGPAASIPAGNVRLFLKQLISNGVTVQPWVLLPTDRVDLEKDLTRAFWFSVKVPTDVPAGEYTATVSAAAGNVKRELPVSITVYPVKLRTDIPISVGFYYGPPDGGQFALFDKMADYQPQRDRMLKEQLEMCHEMGFDSIEVDAPAVTDVANGHVTLDFSKPDKFIAAAKAAGLYSNPNHNALMYTLSIGRGIGAKLLGHPVKPGEEFGAPGFDALFVDSITQVVAWAQKQQIPLVMWLVDEPRENPNPWNRNFADTVKYLDLAGQVKGAVRMIDLLGDTNSEKDYTPMIDHMDIVDTHAGKASEKSIQRAMTDPKLKLWIYNTGMDRYSNGFYVWRVGAGGKHEWHFNMWNYENPGKYPGKDVHNPLMAYEFGDATVAAPLRYRGGLLPKEKLFTMATGVNDYRYIWTLQQAIADVKKAGNADPRAGAAAEAEALLQKIKDQVPVLPEVKNLVDLTAVGEGIGGGEDLEAWKKQIAEYIVKLQK